MRNDSDKAFWHRFVDVYERAFESLGDVRFILEFGVFKGDSIRWLAERFPGAQIVGCDIVPQQPSWPVSPRIGYVRIDQGAVGQIQALFRHFKIQFDLIIEDGSHQPVHQRNCLVEALPYVRSGGLYVLEDIHTAHPTHPLYRAMEQPAVVGPLHLLLALEHLQARGMSVDADAIGRLSTNSLFTADDVRTVAGKMASVEMYRRATLPLQCYH